jgi:hypothetical protein
MLLTVALFNFFVAVFLTIRNFLRADDDTPISKVLWWALATALYLVALINFVLARAL